MIRIVFVCHGNICRSPMAEFIMKDYVKSIGRESDFLIESRALHTDAIGMPIYRYAREVLERHGVTIDNSKRAQLLKKSDYDKFDYIICMDMLNVDDAVYLFGADPEGKIKLLLDFDCFMCKEVADPWYTRDFERTYREISSGVPYLYSRSVSEE